MSRWSWLAAGLLLVGAFSGAPGLLLVGTLLFLSSGLRTLWSRYGLRRVHYERELVRDRVVLGEAVELRISAWNDKPLPLAWLEADDLVTEGTIVRERPTIRSDRPGFSVLRNTWTLGPWERVTTHLHVVPERRGVYRFGPVRLQVADLFGRDVATESTELPDALLVRPRSVPVRLASPELAPLGETRARHGFHHDPALFAGVRQYQAGDPRRSIHWRASARMGRPVSKRFEPATQRQTVIAIDMQTNNEPYWMMIYEEELLESLVVAAASIARFILDEGGAVGIAANAWSGTMARTAFLAPAAGQAQLPAVLDVLARLSVFASAPFELLLGDLPARMGPGTSVVVLSGRQPGPVLTLEARLVASGVPVTHVALGDDRAAFVSVVRKAGLDARAAHLDGGWRNGQALELAG